MSRAFFSDLLSIVADRARRWRGAPATAGLLVTRSASLYDLCTDLLSRRGEASGTAIALDVLDQYARLDEAGRLTLFEMLAKQFGPDRKKLEQVVAAWHSNTATESDIHFASEPRRQELFRRLNRAPGGTTALVRIREQLLTCLSSKPELTIVDRDMAHLFFSWFNRGFLVLKPIDWTSPVNILERIIQHEAVHAIQNWDDLRNRLKPTDRRCFAFFHPQLADEPLIFVEVALTKEIPVAIAPLLEFDRVPISAHEATIAVFYSISNTQKGLAGVSFGSFLIKQVVADLQYELPHLKKFVTLSPIPGFASWLNKERADKATQWVSTSARAALKHLDEPGWHTDPIRCATVQQALLPIVASYLVKAQTSNGRPIDPVARFHLGNGASLERLNFLGDSSSNGLEQSHGLMVNYCYALDHIEKNHEAYAERGTVVASPAVHEQLRANMLASIPAK